MKYLKLIIFIFACFMYSELPAQNVNDSLMLLDIYIPLNQSTTSIKSHNLVLKRGTFKVIPAAQAGQIDKLTLIDPKGNKQTFTTRDHKTYTSDRSKASFVLESTNDNPRTNMRRVRLRLRNAAVLRNSL